MTLTPARLPFVDLFAVAVIAALTVTACYPEPEQDEASAALVKRYAPVLEQAGLGAGLPRLNGLSVRVHPGSDGGSFPPPENVHGFRWLYDYGGEACASYPGERVCEVNDLSSPYVCHCFGHVARTDVYSAEAGECLDPFGADHAYFDSVQFDQKCRAAAEEQ